MLPLARILNQPSANQYGSLRRLVLFPELPSYDILRSSIHHHRCRYEMSNILGITMFDLNQSFLFLQHFHPIPHQCPDANTPSPFLNYHNPRPSSFPKYSHPPSLSNYLLLPHLPDRNGLPLPSYLSYLYPSSFNYSTYSTYSPVPSPRTRSLNLGKANLLQFNFFVYLSAITAEFSYQSIV